MFSAFRNAWNHLISSLEVFSKSIEEANSLFREHFHLDAAPETPALHPPQPEEEQPARNGRGRSKVSS